MTALAEQLAVRNLAGRPPVQPGEPAPDFALAALHREGTVSLADYRGRSAVLLAIERGLYCPFCRRHIAQLGFTTQKLKSAGVEVLVVVGTQPERARMYLKHRPARVPLAADPRFETHRAYGLPKFAGAPEIFETLASTRVNPFGDLPEARPLKELADALTQDDPYEWTDADQEAFNVEQVQTTGQILIDADGIVRWRRVEGEKDGLAGLATFPSDDELLAAAGAL